MHNPDFDVIILGNGPAGSALALALARRVRDPARIALLGPERLPAAAPGLGLAASAGVDPRSLAINQGSRAFLDTLNAWPPHSAAIRHVHVSQRQRLGRVIIDHTELGVPQLGNVVRYDDLLDALHEALASSAVTRLAGRALPRLAGHLIEFDHGDTTLTSHLAVLSDGGQPHGIQRVYGQYAVLATVRAARPKPGWAYERFTRSGPLAILPHPQGDDLYSVVWCCPPKMAETLQAMPDREFEMQLQNLFGDRLGRFQAVGRRAMFPLSLHAGPSRIHARCIAVGNAAQTLHPVAGQGLNLGLRDVAQLAQSLNRWLLSPETDPDPWVSEFTRRRLTDRCLTMAITDFLPRVFSTRIPLVEHLGGAGLFTMDLLPPLRRQFARQLLHGLRS